METQTRFDLAAAITKWQEELAAQADLTPIVRRELETHLRDTIAEMRGRGLNNEESFWLARRRVGQPQQLNEEFLKSDPTEIWRKRAFLVSLAMLVVPLWIQFSSTLSISIVHIVFGSSPMPHWANVYMPMWAQRSYYDLPNFALRVLLNLLPIYLLAVSRKGRKNRMIELMLSFFQSRGRFLIISGIHALMFIVCSESEPVLIFSNWILICGK